MKTKKTPFETAQTEAIEKLRDHFETVKNANVQPYAFINGYFESLAKRCENVTELKAVEALIEATENYFTIHNIQVQKNKF